MEGKERALGVGEGIFPCFGDLKKSQLLLMWNGPKEGCDYTSIAHSSICNLRWQDKASSIEVFQRCYRIGIHNLFTQLYWNDRNAECYRISKAIFYGTKTRSIVGHIWIAKTHCNTTLEFVALGNT